MRIDHLVGLRGGGKGDASTGSAAAHPRISFSSLALGEAFLEKPNRSRKEREKEDAYYSGKIPTPGLWR